MSLDLLVPFTSTAPAWTRLEDGPLQRLFPAAFSSDEKILYVFHVDGTNSPWQYNVQEDNWEEVTAVKFQNAGWEGIGAVTDPSTGLIYLAGGYDDVSAKTNALKVLNTFDPVSKTIHTDYLPPPERVFPVRWYYGNVWSQNRSSVIYWGGNNREPNQQLSPVENGVTEMSPSAMADARNSPNCAGLPLHGSKPGRDQSSHLRRETQEQYHRRRALDTRLGHVYLDAGSVRTH
ncbi:hypothetical protein BGZ95_012029 [Linnemannia exigua]|uniref:Uncharacterized protein n=1 Tax=Linnemannia exigua TaxID=604196 RepID=A0AAD4DJS1_9FUNG|nr:hypothetical protein BGZ95_012029 [Linnemannia exigua]